jgi:hypothetical protein
VSFSASETFGVGVDLGSPVFPDYFERRPFPFEGTIESIDVKVFGAAHSEYFIISCRHIFNRYRCGI